MLHTAQDLSYTTLASANSEAEISSLDLHKARAAFNLCGFFVRVASSFTGGLRVEPKGSPISLCVGTANARSLPTKLAVWSAGSKNLLHKETAMHDCIAHCPVCGRKYPIPVLGNLDQKVEIRCVCRHTFRVGIEELAVSQKLVSPALPAPVQNQKENVMENELIPITAAAIGGENKRTVNAKELHAFLEVGKDFSTWIKDRITQYQFAEDLDYVKIDSPKSGNQRGGDRRSIDYYISLDMAKELSMVERNEKGKQARQYFIQCEKQLKVAQQQFAIPQTLPEALRLAADLADKNAALEKKAKEDAPKVEFCDKVVADNEAMTITRAAKLINYPPRKLKDYIRQIGWLYANSDTPMQSTITSGYMVLRFAHWTDNEGNAVEKPYAHITNKGIFTLYRRMRREGLIEKNEQLELVA